MERGAGRAAAGEDEAAQRRQFVLEAIDELLEPLDVAGGQRRLGDAVGDLVGRIGQLRAEREQVALDADELGVEVGVDLRGAGEAEPRVQLVDLAVGVDARIALGDPRAVEERRLAGVARARVDFHDRSWPDYTRCPRNHRRHERDRPAAAKPPAPLPAPPARRRFRTRLLAWYRRHGRDLPWRRTSDPYHILVSEIMLQQTQVDRVMPKYAEWLEKYPSFHALAAAPEREVTATWYPLGYNIRPRRLQTIAREAVERYSGELPDDHETLLSFKGIGEYTAGAIRSFAFRAARGDPRHQRRARPVSRLRRPRAIRRATR